MLAELLALGKSVEEPRVVLLQLSDSTDPNLLYATTEVSGKITSRSSEPSTIHLRPSCNFSSFLQLDADYLPQDDDLFAGEAALHGHGSGENRNACPQHMSGSSYTVEFRPGLDILFLSCDTVASMTKELRRWYGGQIANIQHVLVQDCGLWHNLDHALEVLEPLSQVRVVYVWLESCRFLPGERIRNRKDYSRATAELQERDQRLLQGKDLVIHYIDLDGNVYGSFYI